MQYVDNNQLVVVPEGDEYGTNFPNCPILKVFAVFHVNLPGYSSIMSNTFCSCCTVIIVIDFPCPPLPLMKTSMNVLKGDIKANAQSSSSPSASSYMKCIADSFLFPNLTSSLDHKINYIYVPAGHHNIKNYITTKTAVICYQNLF